MVTATQKRKACMHTNGSKTHQLLLMLALLGAPGSFFTQTSSGFDQSPASAASSDASAVPPDNSATNVRDRDHGAVTPFTQSNNRSDVEITRTIRRALMEDKSLSTKLVSATTMFPCFS